MHTINLILIVINIILLSYINITYKKFKNIIIYFLKKLDFNSRNIFIIKLYILYIFLFNNFKFINISLNNLPYKYTEGKNSQTYYCCWYIYKNI